MICDDWWDQVGPGLFQSGSVSVDSRQIKSDSVWCVEILIWSLQIQPLPAVLVKIFLNMSDICDWQLKWGISSKLCAFFLPFLGLFSANVTAYKLCKLLVGVHVCFGARTSDNLRSCRICGVAYRQVVSDQLFRVIPCLYSFMTVKDWKISGS